jgi:hypothetical protein
MRAQLAPAAQVGSAMGATLREGVTALAKSRIAQLAPGGGALFRGHRSSQAGTQHRPDQRGIGGPSRRPSRAPRHGRESGALRERTRCADQRAALDLTDLLPTLIRGRDPCDTSMPDPDRLQLVLHFCCSPPRAAQGARLRPTREPLGKPRMGRLSEAVLRADHPAPDRLPRPRRRGPRSDRRNAEPRDAAASGRLRVSRGRAPRRRVRRAARARLLRGSEPRAGPWVRPRIGPPLRSHVGVRRDRYRVRDRKRDHRRRDIHLPLRCGGPRTTARRVGCRRRRPRCLSRSGYLHADRRRARRDRSHRERCIRQHLRRDRRCSRFDLHHRDPGPDRARDGLRGRRGAFIATTCADRTSSCPRSPRA